jgi:CTP synthase (UTP-ammonia lyase)
MSHVLRIALIGEFDPEIPAHRGIELALPMAADALHFGLQPEWLPTDRIDDTGLDAYDGIWCVPGSPYRSMAGALTAIRYARERGRPFLGTCGGFQHAVIEYARNVLHWADAEHAETAPQAGRAVIAPLSCALRGVQGTVLPSHGSRLAAAYGTAQIEESYFCGYSINPGFQSALLHAGLHVAAVDVAGDIRALELPDHPFFVTTLFQPERAALGGRLPPLVEAFVRAAALHALSARSASTA